MSRVKFSEIGERLLALAKRAQRELDENPALRARIELEQQEIRAYGDSVDWGAEVNRVMVAVQENGPRTQIALRRPNAKQFVTELRKLLPAEINRSVTFLVYKPFTLALTEPAPLSCDLGYEYDFPPA